MQRYAIIDTENRTVINVVEYAEIPSNPPPGFEAGVIAIQHDRVGTDWDWDGTTLIEPATPIVETLVPQSISDRQFFQQLAIDGIITEEQALASNAAVIPPPLLAIIEQLPTEQQFDAKMKVSGATTFLRDDPLTVGIGGAYGMLSEQIDAFFMAASRL